MELVNARLSAVPKTPVDKAVLTPEMARANESKHL
jgi:hypothetical protein